MINLDKGTLHTYTHKCILLQLIRFKINWQKHDFDGRYSVQIRHIQLLNGNRRGKHQEMPKNYLPYKLRVFDLNGKERLHQWHLRLL